MRHSELFSKTRKENPADEVSRNAQLLIRAGFVRKEMAGVYSFLPLGLRTLRKIENIIREEMNAIGGQEVLLSSFHPKEAWEKTGRWSTMDDLYKVSDSSGREVVLGPTHEELVVPMMRDFIFSYKDLPRYAYQIQNKFRMELRAKSGILRGREFIMKDLYSFHAESADLDRYYETVKESYRRIFDRVGIGEQTFLTFASGGSFSKYSHEFQTITTAGEDTIHLCRSCRIAVNEEIIADQPNCPECGSKLSDTETAVEVGNIFKLMTKYSAPFNLSYASESGESKMVVMGCYGIGLGRLMGTIVETLADENGLVWPESVAPFRAHLLSIGADKESNDLYDALRNTGTEVLYDDREASAGEKFGDSDLLGMPYRIVVSPRSLERGGAEIKRRTESEAKIVPIKEVVDLIAHGTSN